jgi:UDP-galactopyranose mutase
MSKNNGTIILGAGLSGLSAAYHLKYGYDVYEKETEAGGLCRSRKIDGFTFDYDGHLLHFRDNYAKRLVKSLLGNDLVENKRRSFVCHKKATLPYPFQANISALPEKIKKECILGFIKAAGKNGKKLHAQSSLQEWIYHRLGKGFARNFMLPYNEKFWTYHPGELSCQWAERFIPVPSFEQVLAGGFDNAHQELGYNARFWYPRQGGIYRLADAFEKKISRPINFSAFACRIDTRGKNVHFRNGKKKKYHKLVSSVPLPELLGMIDNLPQAVKKAKQRLCFSSIYVLNIGTRHRRSTSSSIPQGAHWIYFPQKNISFFRAGIWSNFCAALTPPGCKSVYAEVSYSKNKPIDRKKIDRRIIKGLIKAGILSSERDIRVKDSIDIKYGYPVYGQDRSRSLDTIFSYLKQKNIYPIGRYGRWEYMSMEDAILEGKRIAQEVGRHDQKSI